MHEEVPETHKLPGKKAKKERETEKIKPDTTDPKPLSPTPSQTNLLPNDTEGSDNELAIEIIPHICIPVSNKEEASIDKLISSIMPSLDEVLQDLGFTELCLFSQ